MKSCENLSCDLPSGTSDNGSDISPQQMMITPKEIVEKHPTGHVLAAKTVLDTILSVLTRLRLFCLAVPDSTNPGRVALGFVESPHQYVSIVGSSFIISSPAALGFMIDIINLGHRGDWEPMDLLSIFGPTVSTSFCALTNVQFERIRSTMCDHPRSNTTILK